MSLRVPARAGERYGRVLGYLDASTLEGWSGASGVRLLVSRWYARVFGFPELAAHQRFGPIQGMLRRYGGQRVLDLGAGNGLYSLADGVARPGATHILADVSHRHMRRATTTGAALGLQVQCITGSADSLPLPAASVDTVLVIEVLQFLDDDEGAIREIARVLRPGGVWLCEQDSPPPGTPLPRSNEDRLQKRRAGYAPETLRDLAGKAGLVLEASQMVAGPRARRWEAWDGRLFQRNRSVHFLLFPLIRLAAWLTTSTPVPGSSGTVLFCFRKPA
jgi:SAM-dependent methyltransferase